MTKQATLFLNKEANERLSKCASSNMKGLVYGGQGEIEWKEVPKPMLEKATDVVVKIVMTSISGTDLSTFHGTTPSAKPGTTLEHEGIGVIEEVGNSVTNYKKGDEVIISCIRADGSCEYCKKQLYGHCEDGSWILGHLINGTQAEYVRIPHADNSLYAVPPGLDQEALVMLSDILPTGHVIGVIDGCVKPGDVIAIVGAGPTGSALQTAQFYSPAQIYIIDLDANRLKLAKKLGATNTINSVEEDAIKKIMSETKDGVDVAIEAVGAAPTFDICQGIVRPGGHVANIGVHGHKVNLQLQELWNRNITITMGLESTNTVPMLLKALQSGKLKLEELITHRFKLDEILQAYSVFRNAAKEKALMIILSI